jgi:hypothetical protein
MQYRLTGMAKEVYGCYDGNQAIFDAKGINF